MEYTKEDLQVIKKFNDMADLVSQDYYTTNYLMSKNINKLIFGNDCDLLPENKNMDSTKYYSFYVLHSLIGMIERGELILKQKKFK